MAAFSAIDPRSGAMISQHPLLAPEALEQRLTTAHEAQVAWRARPPTDRATHLARAARILRDRAEEWGTLMAREMGKPILQGRAEAEKCAWLLEHFSAAGPAMLEPERVATDGSSSYVRLDPLGLVLAIMPWNFPFWQVFRCAAPALLAGNGVILKHAPNVPGCALALESILTEAGLPAGLFTSVFVDVATIGELLADPRIALVTLTGSERAGMQVAELAGRHLKKAVLELGGSDPFIVLADADLDRAAEIAAKSRCQNNGQSCIAAKRFIVEAQVAAPFIDRFRAALAAQKVGDPLEPRTDLGPLARADLRHALQVQVERSRELGARVILGGEVPIGPGFYYPATMLVDVGPGYPVWDEETFGPVAAVRVVRDAAEAIASANASRYGLGAALFTLDRARAEALAAELDSGVVFINGMVKSDPRLPFGGVKRSGYGRELSWQGLRELVNQKTVWIA